MLVAEELQLKLPEGAGAAVFQPSSDIVNNDVVIIMDKFIAADVLKEVSVYDTIDPTAHYSVKVRRLGDFCKLRQVRSCRIPLSAADWAELVASLEEAFRSKHSLPLTHSGSLTFKIEDIDDPLLRQRR